MSEVPREGPHPITVIGSLNTDLVTVTPRIPAAGETLRATSFTTGFGGKGANQAVACARLLSPSAFKGGAAIRMIGALGDDRYGSDFVEHLKRENIVTEGVKVVEGAKTGTSLIIVDEESGENRILFSEGANGEVTQVLVDAQLGNQPSKKGLMVLQMETPMDSVLHALQTATAQGYETILNPAPASPLPAPMYQNIRHLIVNETEASILSGTPEHELASSMWNVAEYFLTRGVQVIIITLGSKGVYWKVSPGHTSNTMEARKVKAVDTTAAGDAFVGAYAAYLAQGRLPAWNNAAVVEEAIRFATRAASVSVGRQGAQASIPRLDELPDEDVRLELTSSEKP